MSQRKYFGTDGIRGRANTHPMTAEVALRVGLAAGIELAQVQLAGGAVAGEDDRLVG